MKHNWKKLVKEGSGYSGDNELVKEWLKEMYKNEIDETVGAIENERMWSNGADDVEAASMHEGNIESLEEYVEVLQNLLDEVDD